MILKNIDSLGVVKMTENSTELFRLTPYYSKKYVTDYIGLVYSRAGFFGTIINEQSFPLERANPEIITDEIDYPVLIEGIVVLDRIPSVVGLGTIKYTGYGILEVDGSVIYDGRGGTGSGGGGVYDRASPSNITVGGIPSGTDLTGQTWQEVIEKLTVTYLYPAFSSFSISGQSALIEVGTILSGLKTFIWGTSNSSNINNNSLSIKNVNTNTVIASSLANDGSESVDIGVIVNLSPISQTFQITGVNSLSGNFTINTTINSSYPYFYGKMNVGSVAAGTNRPIINQALIDSGIKVLASSLGTVTIPYNSNSNDYLWVAIPSTSTIKTKWYVTALNNGNIGGTISAGGNFFPTQQSLSVTTVLWAGVSYNVYLSNYQSAITTLEFRNS